VGVGDGDGDGFSQVQVGVGVGDGEVWPPFPPAWPLTAAETPTLA
jgi:hypothetical protein